MTNPFLQSIQESGFVGLTILILLFAGSIYSWTLILYKYVLFRQARRSIDSFLRKFSGVKQGAFSLSSTHLGGETDPAYAVYKTGCSELTAVNEKSNATHPGESEDWERLAETMQRSADTQTRFLEKGLIFLATAASTGPLLGILGTVYGVLVAFQGMGRYGSATIDAVAPGISEALVTTVFGLIVAIPALIMYNYFKHSLNDLSFQLDVFIADFINRARDRNPDNDSPPGKSAAKAPRHQEKPG